MSALRRWRIEVVWAVFLCTFVLWLSAAVPVKADRWMYYEPMHNWCYLLQPLNCLWQDPP